MPRSGSTGRSAPLSSARWSPTTTNAPSTSTKNRINDLAGVGWQLHPDLQAAIGQGLGGGGAAVGGGDRADDGQAETGAAVGAGAVGLQSVERLEQGRDLVGGNEGAAVGDRDKGHGAGVAGVDLDPAAGLVVADGVLDQVGDQPLQQNA